TTRLPKRPLSMTASANLISGPSTACPPFIWRTIPARIHHESAEPARASARQHRGAIGAGAGRKGSLTQVAVRIGSGQQSKLTELDAREATTVDQLRFRCCPCCCGAESTSGHP